ncbi:MAG: hypothetical protein ACE144_10710 [Thermodesulfobacteriota bacterium]
MPFNDSEDKRPFLDAVLRRLIGAPRDIRDASVFHKISLIPVLAWIGLGAGGLSSSAYGPEEAFRTIEEHTYLAIFLALATVLTVFIISYAYSRILEYFPHGGGGGYGEKKKLLGEMEYRYLLPFGKQIYLWRESPYAYPPPYYPYYPWRYHRYYPWGWGYEPWWWYPYW